MIIKRAASKAAIMEESIKVTAELLADRASILEIAAVNMNYIAAEMSYIATATATAAAAAIAAESLMLKVSYPY